MPMPAGVGERGDEEEERGAEARRPSTRATGGAIVLAASTTAAAGRTIRFGMMWRSTSVAEIATSAAQKNAATAASQVSPKRSTQAATRSAVVASTSG